MGSGGPRGLRCPVDGRGVRSVIAQGAGAALPNQPAAGWCFSQHDVYFKLCQATYMADDTVVSSSFFLVLKRGDEIFRLTDGLLYSSGKTGYCTALEAPNEAGRGRFTMLERRVGASPRKARLTLGCTQKKVGSFRPLVIEWELDGRGGWGHGACEGELTGAGTGIGAGGSTRRGIARSSKCDRGSRNIVGEPSVQGSR